MSDNMSQENENTIKDDEVQNEGKKKQFYSINLTSERVFLIFVLIIAIIAVVVVAVVFSTSSKSVTKNKNVASEEVIDEIVNSDDFAFFDDENTTELLDTEEVAAAEEAPALAPEKITISDNNEKENAKETVKAEKVAAAKPEVKINDKVSYSSSYSEKSEVPSTPQPVQKSAVTAKAPAEKQAVKQTAQGKKWIIQIGSFTSEKSAANIADFYKKESYPAYVKEFVKDGKTYYRLRIGPYDSDVKAQEALVKIKASKYGKDSFVAVGYF